MSWLTDLVDSSVIDTSGKNERSRQRGLEQDGEWSLAGLGTVIVLQCPECGALVPRHNKDAHIEWHATR